MRVYHGRMGLRTHPEVERRIGHPWGCGGGISVGEFMQNGFYNYFSQRFFRRASSPFEWNLGSF
jgi:hypothetical protein